MDEDSEILATWHIDMILAKDHKQIVAKATKFMMKIMEEMELLEAANARLDAGAAGVATGPEERSESPVGAAARRIVAKRAAAAAARDSPEEAAQEPAEEGSPPPQPEPKPREPARESPEERPAAAPPRRRRSPSRSPSPTPTDGSAASAVAAAERGWDEDHAAAAGPEAEVSREARNLFVRHKVPPRLAESGYRVSMVLRAAPDASAREKTRAKSWDWRLAQDWTLALDEGDEAPTGREPVDTRVQPGDAPGGEPRGRRLAPQAAETFASRVSNAAAAEAEVDAWVARRFGGDCAKALAAIEAVPFTATALKRQAPNPERLSKTQAAKKKRGGSS